MERWLQILPYHFPSLPMYKFQFQIDCVFLGGIFWATKFPSYLRFFNELEFYWNVFILWKWQRFSWEVKEGFLKQSRKWETNFESLSCGRDGKIKLETSRTFWETGSAPDLFPKDPTNIYLARYFIYLSVGNKLRDILNKIKWKAKQNRENIMKLWNRKGEKSGFILIYNFFHSF